MREQWTFNILSIVNLKRWKFACTQTYTLILSFHTENNSIFSFFIALEEVPNTGNARDEGKKFPNYFMLYMHIFVYNGVSPTSIARFEEVEAPNNTIPLKPPMKFSHSVSKWKQKFFFVFLISNSKFQIPS